MPGVPSRRQFTVTWTARAEGMWLLHCHITNNDTEPRGGGLTIPIKVS